MQWEQDVGEAAAVEFLGMREELIHSAECVVEDSHSRVLASKRSIEEAREVASRTMDAVVRSMDLIERSRNFEQAVNSILIGRTVVNRPDPLRPALSAPADLRR